MDHYQPYCSLSSVETFPDQSGKYIMEQRRKLIADGLQNAQDTQDEANRLKAEYEEALSGAKKNPQRLLTKHGSMPGQSMTALLVKPERRRAISLRMQKKMCVSSVNRQ